MPLIDPEQRKQWKLVGRVGAIGIQFVISIMIGYAGGSWLDRHLPTRPWMTLVGVLLGVAAGFKSLYDIAKSTDLDKL